MLDEKFAGKPPKSADQIRDVLRSIHSANEPQTPGPYARALTDLERQILVRSARNVHRKAKSPKIRARTAIRSPAFRRMELLRRATCSGGFVGLLLGYNFGLMAPILSGDIWLIGLTPVSTFIGASVGFLLARVHVMKLRPDWYPMRPFEEMTIRR